MPLRDAVDKPFQHTHIVLGCFKLIYDIFYKYSCYKYSKKSFMGVIFIIIRSIMKFPENGKMTPFFVDELGAKKRSNS